VRRRAAAGLAALCALAALPALPAWAAATARAAAPPRACPAGTVYLTLDTGNMRHAELIADILRRHEVRATFFLANEKTDQGGWSLDDSWIPYWRRLLAEGHAFGSHTWDHVYFRSVLPDGRIGVRPQFGPQAGRSLQWDAAAVCAEIDRVDARFREITGQPLQRWWRAPGGRAPEAALAAARRCGWAHVHWAPAGFLGDELPSDRYPNQRLLQQALAGIRGNDILIAHLGIWSRQDPYAPMLDPLIAGLKARGLCFATLREHPSFKP